MNTGLLKRAVETALLACALAVMAIALLVAYGSVPNPWYRVVVVTGGSMRPTIGPGDVIIVTRPSAHVPIGTVATFSVDGEIVTHRIMGAKPDGTYVTKGDANAIQDNWAGSRVGVVGIYRCRIPHIGGLILQLRSVAANGFGGRR